MTPEDARSMLAGYGPADCTCTMTRPATHLDPAEWEPELDCPLHGCDYLRGTGVCVLIPPCRGSDGPACMGERRGDFDVDLSDCPYLAGTGTCNHGCRDEPECVTR